MKVLPKLPLFTDRTINRQGNATYNKYKAVQNYSKCFVTEKMWPGFDQRVQM